MGETSDQVSILLVDDHPDKLLSVEALVGDLGRVVCATSGREALRKLLHETFAVILLDVNMPGMDGFETASIIRQRRSCEHTPIIFLTAYGDEMFIARGYSLGAVDYIQTPVVPDVLRTKVGVFVDLYRKTEQVKRQAEHLRRRTEELADLALQATQAEGRERRRLAGLLHDHLQQLLVAANMRLSSVALALGAAHGGQLDQVGQLINKSIDVSRSLTTQLSPPILYEGGLMPALHWLGRRMREDHGLAVGVHDGGAPPVHQDDARAFLFEVVRELLFNIVKHAGVREAQVTVSGAAPGAVCITVEDRGRGFDAAATRPCADRFGLFSIRQRLNLLGGRLEIVSAEGRGTQVTIELPNPPDGQTGVTHVKKPFFSAPAPPTGGDAAPTDPPLDADDPTCPPPIRVILADDHEMLRKGLAGLIADQPDMRVVAEASNGVEAVELSRRVFADVVVMDVSMPVMSGVEATRRITDLVPHLRVIGLSMHEQESMASEMRQAGAAAYLTKDGPPEALMAAIRAAGPNHPRPQPATVRPSIHTAEADRPSLSKT